MWDALASLKAPDWVLAASTVLGPILAVQAQKWVERLREKFGKNDVHLPDPNGDSVSFRSLVAGIG